MTYFRTGVGLSSIEAPGMGGAGGSGGSSPAPTYHLIFDGVDDQIVVPAAATVNNLPLGDFTIEVSLAVDTSLANGSGYLFFKGTDDTACSIQIENSVQYGRRVSFFINYDNTFVDVCYAEAANFSLVNGLAHYEFTFDYASRTTRIFINGIEATYSYTEQSFSDYLGDAAIDLHILTGIFDSVFYPAKANPYWFRISNVVRHVANFTPPSLTIAPASDANTVLLLKLDEGSGTTANDSSANNNDGTITGATWVDDSATYHLYFDGITDKILVPASATLDNLPLGDFTIDFSIELDGSDVNTDGYIVKKGDDKTCGWSIYPYRNSQGDGWWMDMSITFTDGYTYVGFNDPTSLDGPIHIEYVYTASTKFVQLFIDGIEIIPYLEVGGSDYLGDSSFDLDIMASMWGVNNYPLPGNLRWLRIATGKRHTADFIPPSLTVAPAKDANTLLLLALDEGAGLVVADTSGHNNHGTIMGATWVQNTYHLTFDGVDDKITIPSSPSLTDLGSADFTIDMSVFLPDPAPGDASVEGYLYSKSGLGGSDAYKLYAYLYAMGYVEIPVPVVGEHGVAGLSATMSDYPSSGWHHIEIAWDSIERTVAVYVDGVALNIYQASMTNILPTDAFHNFVIASVDPALTTVTDFLPATYHWFRVSNTVRHADDFTPPSLTIAPVSDANTLLLLTMNEGAGTTAYDSSGKGNDGVITGATWGLDKTAFHTAFVGAYDDIPNIAAAYGMRRLRSDYQGKILRLRRSTDNLERDVPYLPNGDIDAQYVSFYLNGASGYVVTWYDQSGNGNHATQATMANQPLYVASGQNSKPVLRFPSGDYYLENTTNNPVTAGSAYSVMYGADALYGSGGTLFCVRRSASYSATMAYGDGQTYIHGDGVEGIANVGVASPGAWKLNFYIGSHIYAGANYNPTFFVNGVSEPIITPGTYQTTPNGTAGFFVGRSGAGQNWVGDIAEMVVCGIALSDTDRQAAEAAANSYWAIY